MNNPLVQLTELCEEILGSDDPIEFSKRIGSLMQDVENRQLIDEDKMEGFITYVLGLLGIFKFSTYEQNETLHKIIYQMLSLAQDKYLVSVGLNPSDFPILY